MNDFTGMVNKGTVLVTTYRGLSVATVASQDTRRPYILLPPLSKYHTLHEHFFFLSSFFLDFVILLLKTFSYRTSTI